MFPTAALRALARRAAALAPSQCALCHAWPAERLCAACRARFAAARPRCVTCAREVPAGVARCGGCLREPPPLDGCTAAVDYAYPWAGIIAEFKFRADPSWATALAGVMRQAPGAAEALEHADLVLPIALSPARVRQRGYQQALQLARALGAGGRVRTGVLLRLHDTPAQSALARGERLRNLRGALALDPLAAGGLAGRRVLLVDDVMTTGATLHAAALALRPAGPAHIGALVLARTPPRYD